MRTSSFELKFHKEQNARQPVIEQFKRKADTQALWQSEFNKNDVHVSFKHIGPK